MKDYDYSLEGIYFVTLCTHRKSCIFGNISDGLMELNKWGVIAKDAWLKTNEVRNNVALGPYVVMPNHFHAIVAIAQSNTSANKSIPNELMGNRKLSGPTQTLGSIVRGYKASVTRQINGLAGREGIMVWQRNYWEHIIRNPESFEMISNYIQCNPENWDRDRFFE